MTSRRRVAIVLVTDCNDNLLMGKRQDSGLWTNPGGHLENKEEPFEGAVRELKEETGLDPLEIHLAKCCYVKEKNILIYLFCAKVDPRQHLDFSKDPDKEFSQLEYVDPNEVKEALHVPLDKNVALKYWAES